MDFASLQTRLGRVNPGPELLEQVPVVLVAFDLLHLDGDDLLETPLRERRAALDGLDLPARTNERMLLSQPGHRPATRTRSNRISTTRVSATTRA